MMDPMKESDGKSDFFIKTIVIFLDVDLFRYIRPFIY
jgi:hypothetical protein